MFEQAQEAFAGATPLMEWMVRQRSLPLRKAKMVVEKAVKYSERERSGKVSYQSLKRALSEMEIDIPIFEQEVEEIQRPEKMVTPPEKRVRENLESLREKVKANEDWLINERRKVERAKGLVSKMEKRLGS
jgi:Cdc6-like AAA superfamily ATPase